MKKRGFTDRLYWLNFKITWLFVAVCVLMTFLSGVINMTDLSIINVGVPAAFAELGIHTGFVVWKAKVENIEKHKCDMDIMNIV